jgi:C4-dicarboxylate-binding protein DctP
MKKKLQKNNLSLVCLVITLSILLLATSCGQQASAPTGGNAAAGNNATTEPIQLRLVTDYNIADMKGQLIQSFSDKVEERSQGRIVIDTFTDGQLYKSDQYIDAIPKGSVDIAFALFGRGWPNVVPELTVLSTAGFENIEEALTVLQGPLGTKLSDLMAERANTKVLCWAGVGSADASASSKRVFKNIDDMKGLRMRVVSSAQMSFVQAFGAVGTVIVPAEAYLALQRGTVDGQFCTSSTSAVSNKFYEVAKYWTRAAFVGVPAEMGFVMNLDSWNKLPEDLQKIVQDTAQEVGLSLIEEGKKATDKDWDVLTSQSGVEIYMMTPEELAQWVKLMEPAQREALEKAVSKEVADELMSLVEQVKSRRYAGSPLREG